MPQEKHSQSYNEEFPNVYQKWLRTRLNYAVTSVSGEPSAPGFIEAVVTGGGCKYLAASGLRDELWVKNKYPHSDFFGNKVVKFHYPPQVTEVLDFRFCRDPLNKPQEHVVSSVYSPVYDVSLRELATIPSWGPPSIAPEHYPCCQDVPLVPQDLHPICCKGEHCSPAFCQDPFPGPLVQHGRRDCGSRFKPA